MIIHFRYITAGLGLVIALLILVLVRRDRLHAGYSYWWLLTALIVAVAGFFPQLVDIIGHTFGIAYPPILPLVLGYCLILLKILTMDLERSKQEQKIRILTQRLALYESQQRDLEQKEESAQGKRKAG